jgi:hypothetical protein
MGIFQEFAKKFRPVTPDKEPVETIGVSDLFVLDGTKYNPDKITLETYDKIYKHYQVKAAIATLSFSIQQIEWFIKSDDPQIQRVVQLAVDRIWNSLIRSISKSFRYGYSPNVKVWELSKIDGKEYVVYKQIKDLDPKYCKVKLDKYGNYQGFYYKENNLLASNATMLGQLVPPEYSFWYTSEMENGNHYGNSALKAVYKSWYFSEKMHVFCNRYYERFGEPLVVGRAPSVSYIKDPKTGAVKTAQEAMREVIASIRSHSSAQLPSDQDEKGNYVYDLKYLESQMRGFDFENYLSRLDREISFGLLFPALIMGGDKGGSYALGESQIQAFYTNLMGIMDNVVDYVNAYIIPQLVEYNFGPDKEAKMSYQPLSASAKKNIHEMIMQIIKNKSYIPEIDQLEERSGMKLKKLPPEVKAPVVQKEKSSKLDNSIEDRVAIEAKKAVLDNEINDIRRLKSMIDL